MDKLPFEILRKCMAHLNAEEMIPCLRVCKSWYEKVRIIAYETVAVASQSQFTEMYKFFNENEECGKFVKNLFIIECKLSATVYISLPSLFPNIKKFYVKEKTDFALPASMWNTREAKTQFKKWKDSIEDITEVGSPICTEAIFYRNVCPKLKSLELASLGLATELDRIKFIKRLKGAAPNLTHLKLLFASLDREAMELLLNSTPNLKLLALTEVGFIPSISKLDCSKIEPHPGLETLAIREGSFCGVADSWLTYFSTKLIHLKNLCINKMEDNDNYEYFDDYKIPMVNWLLKLSKLEYYRVQAFPLTENIVKAMDKSGIKLKRIDLGSLNYTSKCFKWLLNSKQKNSLEIISTMGQPYQSIVSEFKNFLYRLAEVKELKHLSIFQDQSEVDLPNRVPLDEIIKHLPNLESLKMDFGEYAVEYDKDEPIPDIKLKTLVLIEFTFDAFNRFKDSKKKDIYSWKYLENTVLPNTKFIKRELEETTEIEESYFNSICNYKEYENCRYDTTTYDVFEAF